MLCALHMYMMHSFDIFKAPYMNYKKKGSLCIKGGSIDGILEDDMGMYAHVEFIWVFDDPYAMAGALEFL